MNYALTGGSAAREAELQKTLQHLLERYNGTLQPTPVGMQQGTAPWGGVPNQQTAAMGLAGLSPIQMQQNQWGGMQMSSADIGITGKLHSGPGKMPAGFTQGQMGGLTQEQAIMMQNGGLMTPGMGAGIQYKGGDFGSVLRTMNAERMQLEGELREEEDKQMKEFSEAQVSK